MASKLAGVESVQRFLARKLTEEQRVRVRGVEPVIVAQDDSRAVKYIVFDDKRIYSTENPPKRLTALLDFADITQMLLSHDQPEFMKDEAAGKSHHVQIKYRKLCKIASPFYSPRITRKSSVDMSAPGPVLAVQAPTPRTSTHSAEPQAVLASAVGARLSGTSFLKKSPRASLSPPTARASLAPRRVSEDFGLTAPSQEQWQDAVLSLHTLSASTTLYQALEAAWECSLVKATLACDVRERDAAFRSEEDTAQLFRALMQELTSADSLDAKFELVGELTEGTQRNLFLQKLFWRSKSNYCWVLEEVRVYLRPNPAKRHTHRCDDLEYVAALVTLLANMLFGAHSFQERLMVVQLESPYSIREVLALLLCTPDLTPLSGKEQHAPDTKTTLARLTQSNVNFLVQLFSVAQQISWGGQHADLRHFSVSVLCGELEKLKYVQSDLLPSLVSALTGLLSSSSVKAVETGEDAVHVFNQCRLLELLASRSGPLAEHIRAAYKEDFRYFIAPGAASLIVKKAYPVGKKISQCVASLRTWLG
eukprot:m.190345 g.190345  ORF g.190345 m.190345 type:complete len:535 (-) comp21697_c0_seq4:65-1669(-)